MGKYKCTLQNLQLFTSSPTFKCLNHSSLRNHVQLLLHDTKIDAITSLKLPALHWWWTSLSHHIDRCELILWFSTTTKSYIVSRWVLIFPVILLLYDDRLLFKSAYSIIFYSNVCRLNNFGQHCGYRAY